MTPTTLTPSNFRKFRKAVALTQAGLAAELGVTQQQVDHMEAGRHPVTPRTIMQLEAYAKLKGIEGPRVHPRRVILGVAK